MLRRIIKRTIAVIREEFAWFKIRVDFRARRGAMR